MAAKDAVVCMQYPALGSSHCCFVSEAPALCNLIAGLSLNLDQPTALKYLLHLEAPPSSCKACWSAMLCFAWACRSILLLMHLTGKPGLSSPTRHQRTMQPLLPEHAVRCPPPAAARRAKEMEEAEIRETAARIAREQAKNERKRQKKERQKQKKQAGKNVFTASPVPSTSAPQPDSSDNEPEPVAVVLPSTSKSRPARAAAESSSTAQPSTSAAAAESLAEPDSNHDDDAVLPPADSKGKQRAGSLAAAEEQAAANKLSKKAKRAAAKAELAAEAARAKLPAAAPEGPPAPAPAPAEAAPLTAAPGGGASFPGGSVSATAGWVHFPMQSAGCIHRVCRLELVSCRRLELNLESPVAISVWLDHCFCAGRSELQVLSA